MSLPTNHRLRRRSIAWVLVASALLLFPSTALAAVLIQGADILLGWDVTYDGTNDKFVYRYTIQDLRGSDRLMRVTIAEDQDGGHAGFHDETAVLVPAGGAFGYDAFVPGVPAHNYDWSGLLLPASGTVTLGFDDLNAHGPHGETFNFDSTAQKVRVFGIPVPGLALWSISIQPDATDPSRIKRITHTGSSAVPASGGGWLYKNFVRNSGNVPIGNQMRDPMAPGPCPNDMNTDPSNHSDFYVNEHPTHRRFEDEDFARAEFPENQLAGLAHTNSFDHDGLGVPAGIVPGFNYAFEDLGNGPAAECWMPGRLLTLGWWDPHGPARVATAGRVVGSFEEGFFDEEFQLIDVPSLEPTEIPTLSVLGLGALALVLAAGALWLLRRRAVSLE